MYDGKAISNKYVLHFCLRKVSIVSEDLIVIGSLFQTDEYVGSTSACFQLYHAECI